MSENAKTIFSYSFHQTDRFVHSAGIIGYRKQVEKQLEESANLRTVDGRPFMVACVVEMVDMPLATALRVGELSRSGLSPLQALVCATSNLDSTKLTSVSERYPSGRKLEDTIEYRAALVSYTSNTSLDISQQIALLTQLHEISRGRIILDVEGNTPDILREEDINPFMALSRTQWETGMQMYKAKVQAMVIEVIGRERILTDRIIKLIQEEGIYAVVIRIGGAHVSLEAALQAAGVQTASEEDVDLFGGRRYPEVAYSSFVRGAVALNGDISQISELDWWKNLIAEYIEETEMDLVRSNPSGDVLGRYIEIVDRNNNTVERIFKSMDDIRTWQLYMEEAFGSGIDYLTAHKDFVLRHDGFVS